MKLFIKVLITSIILVAINFGLHYIIPNNVLHIAITVTLNSIVLIYIIFKGQSG